ncbi:DISARM system helicase DrmA [Burkholderia sp. LMG 13014]|uniref:DISARM system helicase DrmA n=1 Tax=Burkholderia sp. LMG 13014 TaxID=2709306 RepID=UPI00196519A7|nr:DISARM system helicase DrmA [Burkholderia sp. LMG 13014]
MATILTTGAHATPALATKTPSDLREELTDMVIQDLLGPAGGPDEELNQNEDHVYQRYLVGMLAPQGHEIAGGELDELAAGDGDEGEEGAPESGVPAGGTYFPSSMGLSFVVAAEAQQILVEAEWGQYLRVKSDAQAKTDGNPANVWKRRPITAPPLVLDLQDCTLKPTVLHHDYPQVLLLGRMRLTADGWVVTLFMVNQQQERTRRNEPKDEVWVFQPKLRVRGAEQQPIFMHRRNAKADLSRMDPLTREETETLEMLYRHQREFAVGHGISVHATLPEPLAELATQVETEWVPRFEVPQQTPRSPADDENLNGVVMDMKELAELPKYGLIASLRHIETAYRIWIRMEAAKFSQPAEQLAGHEEAARRAVERCMRALQRIKAGIDLIENDPLAEEAFRFANRAMWQQRIHSTFARKVRKKEMQIGDGWTDLDVAENRRWRLFQLAFVLLNLPSLTDLHHHDRSDETEAVADLLWFATGGGKTEAYLGLTAYTLAMRRLQGVVEGRRGDHGVAVLMRYTLRLLTLQQFQRAAALICACEAIRRADTAKWGETAFRLGLWVGGKTTPNTLSGAANTLRQKNVGGRPSSSGSPLQITSCPWCGSEIKEQHLKVYEAPSDIGRCVTYCGDNLGRCVFTEAQAPKEGLPVMVVDEEIYRRPPSLLIATVDKFAQMPWNGMTQTLFGKVTGVCDRHGFLSPEVDDGQFHPSRNGLPSVKNRPHNFLRPPDLIIQDELHLISGPLGSMVGLYEAAVDELCSWTVDGKKVRPKVVASTATIRRASDQVQKLFVRKLEVFPPQGTSIQDSFFAIQRPTGPQHPGRRYLGICAFGRRYPVAMIRSYVAHMAAAQVLYEKYDRLADPYMTLTGYFNSIRELAGTRRLVEDDIRARLRDADERGLAKRRVRALEELTSRKSGTDIPKILERLEAVFDKSLEALRATERKAGQKLTSAVPYDVILATNMISVGVDIDRLGLMVVAGQPKNTSEYIQATSRVGRSSDGPGLVCTVFNWARPRDLSHYERFEHYHETFYKHVEALSVTPFSARALDRGLTGVMVGVMRLLDDHLNANLKAGEVLDTDAIWGEVFEMLSKRGENATHDVVVGERIKDMLNRRRDEWLQRVHNQKDHKLGYRPEGGATVGLLEQAGDNDWSMFTCLNSLRDVEGTVDLVLDPRFTGLRAD